VHLLSGDGAAAWLQYVAWTLPPTYVFEGMRSLLMDMCFGAALMIEALLINVVLFMHHLRYFLCFCAVTAHWFADPGRRIR